MKQFLYLIIISSLLIGCKAKQQKSNDDKPTVTVTIEPFRYFVEQIAGDDVNVNVMVPAGSSPETYEPTPKQMVDLSKSVLYFKVGEIGFERTWMKKLQQNAPHMKVIDTSAGIELAKTPGGNTDPHTWMSIKNAEIICANIAGALMEMFPDKAEKYKQNYWNYRRNALAKLQDKMDSLDFSVGAGRQTSFVIYHPILTYFAQERHLEQLAIEEEGREPSIGQLQQLINRAIDEDINILFIQKEFANRNIEVFLDATGAKPIEINPLSHDWEGQMLYIMKAITNSRKNEMASEKANMRQLSEHDMKELAR